MTTRVRGMHRSVYLGTPTIGIVFQMWCWGGYIHAWAWRLNARRLMRPRSNPYPGAAPGWPVYPLGRWFK